MSRVVSKYIQIRDPEREIYLRVEVQLAASFVTGTQTKIRFERDEDARYQDIIASVASFISPRFIAPPPHQVLAVRVMGVFLSGHVLHSTQVSPTLIFKVAAQSLAEVLGITDDLDLS